MKNSKYHTFYDYREARQSKARTFIYLLIVGGIFVLIGVVFLILFYKYQTPA